MRTFSSAPFASISKDMTFLPSLLSLILQGSACNSATLSLWSTSPQEVLGLQGKKGRHFTVKTKKKESPKGRITVIPPRLFWGRAKPIACFSKIEHQVEDTPTKIIFLLQLKKTTTKTFWFPEINL